MAFTIKMGVPEMDYYWQDMSIRASNGKLDKNDLKTFKKLLKTFYHLSISPRHPGLNSHEIEPLSKIAGLKIWESYIENHTPAAGRIFWGYVANKNEISILGFVPVPEDN